MNEADRKLFSIVLWILVAVAALFLLDEEAKNLDEAFNTHFFEWLFGKLHQYRFIPSSAKSESSISQDAVKEYISTFQVQAGESLTPPTDIIGQPWKASMGGSTSNNVHLLFIGGPDKIQKVYDRSENNIDVSKIKLANQIAAIAQNHSIVVWTENYIYVVAAQLVHYGHAVTGVDPGKARDHTIVWDKEVTDLVFTATHFNENISGALYDCLIGDTMKISYYLKFDHAKKVLEIDWGNHIGYWL